MNDKSKKSKAVVELAKSIDKEDSNIVVLSTGVRVRLTSVSGSLLDKVVARVKEPEVPTQFIEEKQRNEQNPNDPQYLMEYAKAQQLKGEAALDAMIMFGVELIDGVPEESEWLDKLYLLEKMGTFDLSDYNLDDALEKEFVYKKFIAVSSQDMLTLGKLSGIREEDVVEAIDSFPSEKA